MMENIYGEKTDNVSDTFENIKNVKLFSNETNNFDIRKKMEDITVELCIKCEDVIEAFYQYEEIIFSKDKDAIAKKLLYNALTDSKEKFFGRMVQEKEESVSYYKRTIGELTTIIEELKEENNELLKQNTELIEKVKKMEEERTKIFEWIKNNPIKTSNENVITKLTDMELLSGKKGVYTLINRIENEKKSEIENQLNNNINKEKIIDKNGRDE